MEANQSSGPLGDAWVIVQGIEDTLQAIQAKWDTLAAELANLEQQRHYTHARMTYRTPKNKAGQKYAYVAVHAPGGERTRNYVGLNPEKIAAAQAAIQRGARILELRAQIHRLRADGEGLRRSLGESFARAKLVLRVPAGVGFRAGRAERWSFENSL